MRILIPSLFFALTLLCGCGQKGPLYIEQDKQLPKPSALTNDTQTKEQAAGIRIEPRHTSTVE